MELQGRIAVVTGASSGIGREAARALARAGMHTYAVARREDRLKQLHDEDPRIIAHAADVTDDRAVEELADRVRSEHGACHVLVNNAGSPEGPRNLLTAEDEAALRQLFELNFFGAVRCMRAFADLLRADPPGQVVNVASVAGQVGVGEPGYSSSKFALIGLSESLSKRWARDGVRVTQLNPGFIRTEGFPQEQFMGNPVTRRLVVGPEVVAAALVDAVRKDRVERTVPSWYRVFPVLRHAGGSLFWKAARRVL